MIYFLAQAATSAPARQDLQRLHYALLLILAIGIVGILLILAMLAAWRNFHKRISELEAERDAVRNQDPAPDLWREAADRVQIDPAPGNDDDDDDDDEDDDDVDLYGKDWEPGDDDENPDDDERTW